MLRVNRSALLEVPVELAYQVVVDVEAYPEFLPGCDSVDVLRRDADGLDAKVKVTGAGMSHVFVTRNRHEAASISMVLREGPFRSLEGQWHFTSIGDTGCRVTVELMVDAHGLLATVLNPVADKVANRMVEAFCRRIEDISTGGICGGHAR